MALLGCPWRELQTKMSLSNQGCYPAPGLSYCRSIKLRFRFPINEIHSDSHTTNKDRAYWKRVRCRLIAVTGPFYIFWGRRRHGHLRINQIKGERRALSNQDTSAYSPQAAWLFRPAHSTYAPYTLACVLKHAAFNTHVQRWNKLPGLAILARNEYEFHTCSYYISQRSCLLMRFRGV